MKSVEIIPIRGLHYKLPVLGFRIGGIAYLTDFNYIPPKEFDKLKGVDTLVINALRKEAHISHFTLGEALHVSHLVSPRQTYLTHISHQMGRAGPGRTRPAGKRPFRIRRTQHRNALTSKREHPTLPIETGIRHQQTHLCNNSSLIRDTRLRATNKPISTWKNYC